MFEILITNILVGASLAVDAFAVSVAQGICCKQNRTRTAIINAIYFGVFQFIMPVAGFFLAGTVSGKLMNLGPYISFFMLAFVGGKMLLDSLHGEAEENEVCFSHGKTIMLAIATSIDALAVGVSFAFTQSSVWLPCAIIGITTFVICLAGGLLCAKMPEGSGKTAGIIGGVVLIGIGIKLLLEGVL